MRCQVLGTGVWGPGVCNWTSLSRLFDGNYDLGNNNPTTETPNPDLIPAKERRRSPLCVRMAVEVAAQAVTQAGLNPADTACVFGSSMGDSDITDYMCRTLVTDTKLLSPTKFHNSVHNAPAGYWSISTGCQQAVNSVSGFELTTPITILEAAVFCTTEQRPVLLVLFDIATPETLYEFIPISDSFAAAIVLAPIADSINDHEPGAPIFTVQRESHSGDWPLLDLPSQYKFLETLYTTNPSARILPLFEHIHGRYHSSFEMPLGEDASLVMSLH